MINVEHSLRSLSRQKTSGATNLWHMGWTVQPPPVALVYLTLNRRVDGCSAAGWATCVTQLVRSPGVWGPKMESTDRGTVWQEAGWASAFSLGADELYPGQGELCGSIQACSPGLHQGR